MNIVKLLSISSSLIATLAVPAFAGVTVNSPANKADVASPFKLAADAASCSAQAVSAMGYSLDNSSDTTVVDGSSIDTSVLAGSGAHTLHVKAWGDNGSSCVTDVTITVTTAPTSELLVP